MSESITVQPIGRVRVGAEAKRQEIEILPEFAEGLEGVEEEEHLWVLYWLHEAPAEWRRVLRAHPRGDRSRPQRGVFALHSPMRPNPIAMTRVRLLARQENVLLVEGLDARQGSPVLDLKSG